MEVDGVVGGWGGRGGGGEGVGFELVVDFVIPICPGGRGE